MLLAGGRVFPQAGTVRIRGVDSTAFADAPFEPALEAERNRLVSFVYQNMEFETEEPIGDLFDVVAEGAVDPGRAAAAQAGLITAADLTDRLGARMQELSKGEMQRAIVVMSLLWGSPIIMMDEPLFAWSRGAPKHFWKPSATTVRPRESPSTPASTTSSWRVASPTPSSSLTPTARSPSAPLRSFSPGSAWSGRFARPGIPSTNGSTCTGICSGRASETAAPDALPGAGSRREGQSVAGRDRDAPSRRTGAD
jgi:hypothetical protein